MSRPVWCDRRGVFLQAELPRRARPNPHRDITLPTPAGRPWRSPPASPTPPLPSCARPGGQSLPGPASGTLRLPGNVRRQLPAAGVFFTVFGLGRQARDLFGQLDKAFRQCLKALVILHLFTHCGRSLGRDPFRTLPTVEKALQDEVRTLRHRLASALALEKLPAQKPSAQPV